MKFKFITLLGMIMFANICFADAFSWVTRPSSTVLIPDGEDQKVLISRNGRYIAFTSKSANLVADDSNHAIDLFVKDNNTGIISLVTQTQAGLGLTEGTFNFSRPTSDGNFIAFTSTDPALPQANGSNMLYIKNLITGEITLEKYNANNDLFNADYQDMYLSDDARYVYFSSTTQIDINDNNNRSDIYRKDRQTGLFKLLTVNISGQAPSDAGYSSRLLDVSDNGEYVIFSAKTTQLHVDAAASVNYLGYIRNIQFNTTLIYTLDSFSNLVEDTSNFNYINSVVSNSGTVYYCSALDGFVVNDNNDLADYFVYDNGVVNRLAFPGLAIEISDFPCKNVFNKSLSISADESSLIFSHPSAQLHNNAIGGKNNVYQIDFNNNSLSLLSENNGNPYEISSGLLILNASTDHGKIVFLSQSEAVTNETASSLNQAYLHNLTTDTLSNIAQAVNYPLVQNTYTNDLRMSDNQNLIIYSTQADNVLTGLDYSNTIDLYYFNRATNNTDLIGKNIKDINMSADGRYVVFQSCTFHPITTIDLGIPYVFLYDSQTLQYSQIAKGENPSVNNDGNVVFTSSDDSLVNNDNNLKSDIFLYSSTNQTIERINLSANGTEADNSSDFADIAGSGLFTWIVFDSIATNLIANDNNARRDVFMLNWPNGDVIRISELSNVGGENNSSEPKISSDTSSIVFKTDADDLIGSVTSRTQVMVYDRVGASLVLASNLSNNGPSDSSVRYYGISSKGRYVAFSADEPFSGRGFISIKYMFLFDVLTGVNIQIGNIFDENLEFKDIAVDDSFSQIKLGILFLTTNVPALDTLYGIVDIPSDQTGILLQAGGDGETLTVEVSGNGQVFGDFGLNCQSNCDQIYTLGYEMTLTTFPISDQIFVGWQGDCINTNNGNCFIRMDQNKTIKAIYIESNDRIFIDGFEN